MASTTSKRKPTTACKQPTTNVEKPEEYSGTNPAKALVTECLIEDIPIQQIKPHASNRNLKGDSSIYDLADSIATFGQLEPATVRATGDSKYPYELLSGERRYRALMELKRDTIRATVVRENSDDALVRLAAANSNRRDLNAVERAELISKLMRPISEGGSGLERAAAGKAVGLNSDSGTKNALRILRLPESIRTMIISGKLSERAARRLIPLLEIPAMMEKIESDLLDEENRVELMTTDEWPYWLEWTFSQFTRPMDDREISNWQVDKTFHGCDKMLFKPTAEQLQELNPIEFQVAGEKYIATTNMKLWDKLQTKALERRSVSRARNGNAKKKLDGAAPALSPEEQAEIDKENRAEADRRLKNFTAEWKSMALRCQLALNATETQKLSTLGFVIEAYLQSNRMQDIVSLAYDEADAQAKSLKSGWGSPIRLPVSHGVRYLVDWWRLMLWPVSCKPTKSKEIPGAGELPDLSKLPALQHHLVDQLSEFCGISMRDFWKSTTEEGPQQQLLTVWLGRHTIHQLQIRCKELKLSTKLEKRGELVTALIKSHSEKMLPIPKALV